jgi:hypothetical protein
VTLLKVRDAFIRVYIHLITMQSRLNIQEIAMPAAAAPATAAAAVEEAPEVSLPHKHVFFGSLRCYILP